MHATYLTLTIALFCGSLLSLSSQPHWFVRAWDFPRVQIVAIALGVLFAHLATSHWITRPSAIVSWSIATLTLSLVVWHGCRILPYTPFTTPQARGSGAGDRKATSLGDSRLRVMVSNVELENDAYRKWSQTVQAAEPDVVIVLEPDERWVAEAEPLFDLYPHRVIRPQDNWYGMMMLSRFPIRSHEVRYLVQDDIPSIDARIELPCGEIVRAIGVHPRPPEPIRDNDAVARDAELTLWARELENEQGPVIIGGDLNDVAWSKTSRLFLRTSGLLDPRRGRGLFNTFHADRWWMRFPLDHVFHSTHFTVAGIERLSHVGSDHFPIVIDLQLEPQKQHQHDVMTEKAGDREEAKERIERAVGDEGINISPEIANPALGS